MGKEGRVLFYGGVKRTVKSKVGPIVFILYKDFVVKNYFSGSIFVREPLKFAIG